MEMLGGRTHKIPKERVKFDLFWGGEGGQGVEEPWPCVKYSLGESAIKCNFNNLTFHLDNRQVAFVGFRD